MQSSNPVFTRRGQFSVGQAGAARGAQATQDLSPQQLEQMYGMPAAQRERAMTVDDVVQKSAIMLGLLLLGGAVGWTVLPLGAAFVAALVGFGIAMVVIFKRETSPALIMSYALVQGVFLGAITEVFEAAYPGIAVQAFLGVALVFGSMLALYKSGKIRVTNRFVKVVTAAAFAAIGLVLVNLVASFFVDGGLGIRDGGPLAIAFSLGMIVLGAMFYAIDFDMAEKYAAAGVPEKEAWRAAFGLTLTTVWVYLEILRLLSYLRGE